MYLKWEAFVTKENTKETEMFTFGKDFLKHYKSSGNKWDAVAVEKVLQQTSFEHFS